MKRVDAMAHRGGPERGRPPGAKSGNPALGQICAVRHDRRVSPLLALARPC